LSGNLRGAGRSAVPPDRAVSPTVYSYIAALGVNVRYCRRHGRCSGAEAVLVAVPGGSVAYVPGAVTGTESKAVIDGTSLSGAVSQDRFAVSSAHQGARRSQGEQKSASCPAVPAFRAPGWPAIISPPASGMTAGPAPARIRARADGRCRPRPWLRQPVRPSGARTLRAVNAPGMLAWERQRRTLRPAAGRPGAVRTAAGEGPPPWLPTVAQPLVSAVNEAAELRLCPNPPQPYAHIVILAAQKAANRHK